MEASDEDNKTPQARRDSLPRPMARLLFWPTLLWNMLLGRVLRVRHWWDRVDDHVILGALPLSRDVPRLAAEGVRAVVNTCEEYAGPVDAYARAGIEQLRIPTTDFNPPSTADVRRAVEFMRRHIEQGETVYVHCKAGRARSATVVLCWLIAYRHMTPADGQRLLLEKRPHVHRRLTERAVVREFANAANDRLASGGQSTASTRTTGGASERGANERGTSERGAPGARGAPDEN